VRKALTPVDDADGIVEQHLAQRGLVPVLTGYAETTLLFSWELPTWESVRYG